MKTEFRKYLEEAIGGGNADVAFSAFGRPASVSVRFNPEKLRGGTGAGMAEDLFRCGVLPVPWSREGFLLERRPEFTLDPWLHAGGYYVQDSSAMFVGEMFRRVVCGAGCAVVAGGAAIDAGRLDESEQGTYVTVSRVVRVLDLCAAPGGKTTDLTASLRVMFGENFLLVANEVMKDRVSVLSENVARWGDPNVIVTCVDPAAFAALDGFFDVIVADVPCSGEGMFRKDAGAVEQWSPDNVALCRSRQRRILADVWPALSEGGALVYSTCTFNRLENDDNVLWMCESLGGEALRPELPWSFVGEELRPDVPGGLGGGALETEDSPFGIQWRLLRTQCGVSLVPGFVPGEGQYCAVVRKTGGAAAEQGSRRRNFRGESAGGWKLAASLARFKKYFGIEVDVRCNGETVIAVPQNIVAEADAVSVAVRTVRTGCTVGTLKGEDLVPSTDLALCTALKEGAFETADVPRETALKFLHRDAIALPDAPKGYIILKYNGLQLGFVKNLGNRCNNLYPQSRRIRMDV